MGIDISILCVLCLLRGGAMEIPRIDAPARPDPLRAFALNQTQSAGPTPDLFGTRLGRGLDGVFYHLPAPPSPQPQCPQPLPQDPVLRAFFFFAAHPSPPH